MQIHELPTGNIEDANKLPFDTGTNSYSATFANIANAVVNRTYSALTTTAKTIITAINELKGSLTIKYNTSSTGAVAVQTLYTVDIDVSSNPANIGMITGFSIASTGWLLPLQIYMPNKNTIHVRLVNIHVSAAQTGNLTIYYM